MKIAGIIIPLLLLCRISRCEESDGSKDIEETHDVVGSQAASEKQVGDSDGESRGAKDVGVSAEDTDARQNQGSFPPRIVQGPPVGQFPPFSEFGGFPPSSFQDFQGEFPSRPQPGAFPANPFQDLPGQFPPRPIPGPRPPGPVSGQFPSRPGPPPPGAFPGQFPSRPFAGQRPPRPPPPGPYPGPLFNPPFGPLPLPMSLVNNAISSISEFDDQKCVPRLLCEISSGSMPGIYSGYNPPYYRPYRPQQSEGGFVGQEQLLQLLAALTLRNRDVSPLAFFGGAALLGISSRGRPEHCYKAFPECPQDSNALLDYLNNHRGGFFKAVQPLRIFSGQQGADGPVPRPPPPFPVRPLRPLSPRPLTYYSNENQPGSTESITEDNQSVNDDNSVASTVVSEPRIQTRPDHIVGAIKVDPNRPVDWRFPPDFSRPQSDEKKTIFPQNQNLLSDNYRKGYRKGKKQEVYPSVPQVPINNYPLALPMFFPDRTGTGDLRLDNSELFGTGGRPKPNSSANTGTRYGKVYFPKDIVENVNRPGEINTRFYIIFPGPAN